MLKRTSILAFTVACSIGVTAFCADGPAKKAPKDPAAYYGRLIDEAKTVTKQGLQRLRKLTDEKGPRPANQIASISCANGSVYKQRPDGCFLASGVNPPGEVLTLTLKPARVGKVVRLDFPPDGSLPEGGPGRARNGNFVVSEVEIEPMRAVAAWASADEENRRAARAIDGISDKRENFWNACSNHRHHRTLLLTLDKPALAGTPLIVRLICKGGDAHVPGCISAAVLPEPSIAADVLAVGKAERDITRMEKLRRFALVVSLVGPPSADSPKELQIKAGDTIVALGDSITAGGGYLRNIDTVLAQHYPDLKIPKVIDKGIPGHKADDLARRFGRDVLQLKPAFVTINVGVNDVWHRLAQPHNENALAAYKANIAGMVDAAQEAGIRVILLAPTLIHENPSSEGNKRLPKYVAAMKEIAAEKNCQMVDLHSMFLATLKKKPEHLPLTADGVHMQALGNAVMAAGVLRALGVPDEKIEATVP